MGIALSKGCSRALSPCSHLCTLSRLTVQGIWLDGDMHALINLTTLTKLALLSPLQEGGNQGSWLSVYRSNQQPEERVEHYFTEGKGGDSHKGVKGHRRRKRGTEKCPLHLAIWRTLPCSSLTALTIRYKSHRKCYKIQVPMWNWTSFDTGREWGSREAGAPTLTDQGRCCPATLLPYFLRLTNSSPR